MTLESVWQVLENGTWKSKQALREASGVDDTILGLIISFLDRWNFVDIRRSPELLIRRKRDAISPVNTFDLLCAISAGLSVPSTRRRLAERVACRACGGRGFSFVGQNQVECTRCHEKQWYAIEAGETLISHQNTKLPVGLGLLKRMFVRLGFPQPAFSRNIPKPVRYFWFRCMSCGKVSTDYPHGYSRHLNCESCGCPNYFW